MWKQILNVLLRDNVSEVVANGPDSFFVKQDGVYKPVKVSFGSEEAYLRSIENELMQYVRSPYDFGEYLSEGPLFYSDGTKQLRARCHIMLPPSTLSPSITIAKKSTTLTSLDAIQGTGTFNFEMLEFLQAAVKARMNLIICGATGAGKTTMLESLCKHFDYRDRIAVVEDIPELVLEQPNVAMLNSVPWKPGFDPNSVATLSWCVSQTQRMRVDRIIIGEVRGQEFSDWLTAANSGIEGCMLTLHANDADAALTKMTSFALKGEQARSVRSVNGEIASAVDIIVQLRKVGGKHRVTEITEVTGVISDLEDARPTTQQIFTIDEGKDEFYRPGIPTDHLVKRFSNHGINLHDILRSPIARQSYF